MKRVSFILPAAGEGLRMKTPVPKPFLELAGIPLIIRTLNRITQVRGVAEIVVVLTSHLFGKLTDDYGEALTAAGATKLVPGGATRQESVVRGFVIGGIQSDLVAVHDAVRPFASVALMNRLCDAAAEHGGAVPVLPVIDTLKNCSEDNLILNTVSRKNLFQVQTPQVFQFDKFSAAFSEAQENLTAFTDDASIMEAAGIDVMGVPGERFNLKITTPEDLRLAEALLQAGLV
ncbi:MAG: 2-C-methyl-D-erythritol 4-phosphate cytidylyltransferase [Planctomycetes bacterium]|nr:2-C-methyl-D-erythritol 4-phosphate cytidylyltransferase [Planctomycetota bacterium]